MAQDRQQSKLFEPLAINGGRIQLSHRVVHAPLTRNRGTPVRADSTQADPNRAWVPNDLMVEYYAQRTTPGGLLITEGIPPNQENGMPGVPGIFLPEQAAGWRRVVDAVHAKGGFIYAQLWHSGRANAPEFTGGPAVLAPSSMAWDDPEERFPWPAPHTTERPKLSAKLPRAMTEGDIRQTIEDFAAAAQTAVEVAGFDGVQLHGGNGYLPEQFLATNSNRREDGYGGSVEGRCRFPLELMEALAAAVGQERVAIRLSPFGMYNQNRSEQRLETWTHLCRELKRRLPGMSFVDFVEPRFEQIFSTPQEKDGFIRAWGYEPETLDLSAFRDIFGRRGGEEDGSTPFFTAGGFNDANSWGVLESGAYDAIVYGRWFISNPDLVDRLRQGLPLNKYDRSRFYGPFEDNAVGYTDYPVFSESGLAAKTNGA